MSEDVPLILDFHGHIDFHGHMPKRADKESHLHNLKSIPDSQGNRAERREYARRVRKAKKKDVK